jgi:hypothetical protein
MPLATGVFKQLRIGKETTWGTASAAAGQLLRRTQSSLDLSKDSYQSNEILSSQQIRDARHGVRRVQGSIDGELSPGTYSQLFAGLLRKDFVAGATASALTLTVVAGPPATITRSAGSWITDGFKIGDVVRFTGFTAGAATNNAKNYRIINLTATVLTTSGTTTETVVAASAVAGCTATVTGKKTFVPLTGHTDDSFTVEHWYSDILQSERFVGCKIGSCEIGLPATGIVTSRFGVMGKDMLTGTAAHFASPAALTGSGVLAAVNGQLRVNGTDVAIVTGASISVNGNHSAEPVVGSNTVPAIFPGRITCSGQLTAFFENASLRDAFQNESEVSLHMMLTTSNDANADFVSFTLPRIKLGGASKNDNERGLIQSIPFTALENTNGATNFMDASTIVVQDSLAV